MAPRWPIAFAGYASRISGRPRCTRAQPQGHLRPDSPQPTHRDHRALRLGEIIARIRYYLRGRPAALCRIALRLRAPVPRPDGKARCGRDRGALARHLDRAEDPGPESAL